MKEFGSDFHYIDSYNPGRAHLTDTFSSSTLLADGRQCIIMLIRQYGWKRLWMPEYFCYNIIENIQNGTGINIAYYVDYPGADDNKAIRKIPFKEGDVLLRMNYFGLRSFRSAKDIPVPVLEDHSHDLTGDWARNSDADWCIASLRKIIPIPEGGAMWSPKGFSVDVKLIQSQSNDDLALKRWRAMEEKSDYLKGLRVDKESFRNLFIETEDALDDLELSALDERSAIFLCDFDLDKWNLIKKKNWESLLSLGKNEGLKVLMPESDRQTPFSTIILFDNADKREYVRKKLIESAIYPAVLWNVPNSVHGDVKNFSKRMLSVHCDGRYSENDIEELYNTINTIIQK